VAAEPRGLELKRVLPAPPSVVFAAFSEPNELSKWWGPQGFTTPSLDFDPSVRATYRIEMQPPEGNSFELTGEFGEVDPPARLAFTFMWEPPIPTTSRPWSPCRSGISAGRRRWP
jgi:uncharacterized protein YndB with AHSA1/START domain